MPESYEIVIYRRNVPKRNCERRHRRRRRNVMAVKAILLAAVTCILAVLTIVMCVKAVCWQPPESKVFGSPPVSGSKVTDQVVVQEPVIEPMEEPAEELMPGKQYTIYDVPLSEELQRYTQDVCEEYGVSYPLVIALMKKESEFLPDTISATNDYGIMQINQGNHEWLEGELGITDWFDPRQNILAGVYVLSQLNGYEDVHQILMCYNCGPSGAKKLWAEGIYTTAYSRAVVEIMDGLEVVEDADSP